MGGAWSLNGAILRERAGPPGDSERGSTFGCPGEGGGWMEWKLCWNLLARGGIHTYASTSIQLGDYGREGRG